jgi:hypothetical protein
MDQPELGVADTNEAEDGARSIATRPPLTV